MSGTRVGTGPRSRTVFGKKTFYEVLGKIGVIKVWQHPPCEETPPPDACQNPPPLFDMFISRR